MSTFFIFFQAICANPDIEYSIVTIQNQPGHFLIAKDRIEYVKETLKQEISEVGSVQGEALFHFCLF